MTPFQEVVRLKIERKQATAARQDEIDARTKALADALSHDEAAFIVNKYGLTGV